MRTHFCGLIDEALIGQTVSICGWVNTARVQSHQVFVDLRDHEGIVQVMVEPDNSSRVALPVRTAAARRPISAAVCHRSSDSA